MSSNRQPAKPLRVLFFALLASACGQAHPDLAESDNPGATSTMSACAAPSDGCSCSEPGKTIECGSVERESGNYVSCSMGTRTCAAGVWGACLGDRVTTQVFAAGGGLKGLSLGTTSACAANPCDPYCNNFVDDPTGIMPGSGLTVGPSGLTVSGSGAFTCTGITVTPAPGAITVSGLSPITTTPTTLPFTATLTPLGCFGGTFTPTWAADHLDTAAISTGGALSVYAPNAGPVNVTAYFATLTGTATANVSVLIPNTVGTPAPPAGQAAMYTGAGTAASDVTWIYPYAGTVFPLGIRAPLVQYNVAANPGNSVKLSLRYPSGAGPYIFNYSVITGEVTPSLQQKVVIPQAAWQGFAQTAAGNDGDIVLQRYAGGVLQLEKARTVHFATASLTGNIYYTEYVRNASSPTPSPNPGGVCHMSANSAVARTLDPSSTTAVPIDPFAAIAGGSCPVCHSVSANGKMFVNSDSGWGGPAGGNSVINADGTMTHIADAKPYPGYTREENNGHFSFVAITPDGQYVVQGANPWGNTHDFAPGGSSSSPGTNNGSANNGVTNMWHQIWQLSTTVGVSPVNVTSASASNWGLAGAYMMTPVFSPDGSKLAFINGDSGPGAVSGWRKGLSTFDFNQSAKTFTNRKLITNTWPLANPNNLVMKWPFFESDSRSIVYVTTTPGDLCTTGQCISDASWYGQSGPTNYHQVQGDLWSVDSSAATPTPVKLAKLNTGERSQDADKAYQPTVLPVARGGYRWVVFTSGRPYGNVLNPPGSDNSCLSSQLWVSAVDDVTSGSTDRSHPAFWLPNQNNVGSVTVPSYTNEHGYWVLPQCKAAGTAAANVCSTDADCCQTPSAEACRIDLPAANPPVRHCQSVTSCSFSGASCTTSADCCGGAPCVAAACAAASAPLVPSTYTRDYQAVCGPGTQVAWQLFSWQSTTPVGTSIVFHAATSATAAGLATAVPVPIGTAAAPPVTTPTWTSDPNTVDWHLRNAVPPQVSQSFLRVTMALNPLPATSPTLANWRQVYDCVPSE